MFSKFWKTIKFFIAIAIVLIVLPHSLLPSQSSDVKKETLEEYSRLNDTEKRLSEYKDSEDALKLKLQQLDLINSSRKQNNAPPVRLDILASRVANKMCREAAENDFIGHWDTAGEKPYHRYAFAGGYDHVSENAYGEWSSANYPLTPSFTSSMMKKGHGKFMSERPPADGHRKTVIDKAHNFVGIGYYLQGNQFRYYEEFLDRYLEFENVPSVVKTGESFNIKIKTGEGTFLYFLTAYRDELPVPISPVNLKNRGGYTDYTEEQTVKINPWDLARFRNGDSYSIPLNFSKNGLYYIHIYIDDKEIANASSMNTKGKTQASGIVIKVTN
jgi:uncharacterized protein YkwD